MNVLKTTISLILCLSAAGSILAGCSDNDKEETGILKPIAEHVTGKWDLAESYIKQDGKWVADKEAEGTGQTITLRSDGTAVIAATDANRQTKLNYVRWSANDQTNELRINNNPFSLFSLQTGKFEMGFHQAIDSDTGEMMDGEFKWVLIRMDETNKTLAEKLVGKWKFSKTYEKKSGEWVEISFGIPDEGTYEYKEDGTATAYSRKGDNELTVNMKWSINNNTGEMLQMTDKGTSSIIVSFEDDNTQILNYTDNFDPATGQVVKGEYKDVLVRE